MIKVQHLHKYFNKKKQNEIHVINDVTLEFPEKGLVVLLGASGSGKTTLLNVIGGLDKINSGTISLNESMISKYNANTWDAIRTKNIGYVFQNYNLLKDLSVYDNIAFVLKMIGINDKEEIEKRVNYILQAVNMFKFRKRKASQLSGGQQQRVAIARALVKNPQIIIADEPTGNLDSQNTLEVMNILKVISKEKLVLLVTHEKEIASFYADRIIEIKDGKVIRDEEVTENGNHEFKMDNVIYLKDLKNVVSANNKVFNLELFADDQKELEKLNVKLILKNKTLYLDVDSNINKVKLLSDNVGVKVVNDHFKTKTREEITSTNFNLDVLEHESVSKQPRSTINFKESIRMAFGKILNSTRRGKLMFFAFVLSGMLLAFASSNLFSAFEVNPYEFLNLQKNYVAVQTGSYETPTILPSYSEFTTMVNNIDDNAYINLFGSKSLPLYLGTTGSDSYYNIENGYGYSGYSIYSSYDYAETLNESDLVLGHLPQNNFEIVLEDRTATEFLEYTAKDYGVWSKEALLNETIRMRFNANSSQYYTLRIVGIVNKQVNSFYMTAPMLHLISEAGYVDLEYTYDDPNTESTATASLMVSSYISTDLLQGEQKLFDLNLLMGTMPQENTNQVLISKYTFGNMGIDENIAQFPMVISYDNYFDLEKEIVVTGVYDTEQQIYSVVAPTSNLMQVRYDFLQKESRYFNFVNILTNAPEELATTFTEANLSSVWLYAQEAEYAQTQVILNLSAVLVGVIVLLVLNALGFYFITRSSMMNRIYEVSVYRALGVKKADIVKMFLFEVLFLITITSLLGYGLATVLAAQVQNLFATFQMGTGFFAVNFNSVMAGLLVMYGVDVLFGLLPIWTLLRKTPSEILSKYDI